MRQFTVILFSVVVGISSAGRGHGAASVGAPSYGSQENYGPAQPYAFSYNSQDQEGSHGHSQSFDGRTVRGRYMIQLADGSMRKVEYHADENGFHAKVVSNELGTESKNAADAIFESSAPTGEQAALQYGPGAGVKSGLFGEDRKSFAAAAPKW